MLWANYSWSSWMLLMLVLGVTKQWWCGDADDNSNSSFVGRARPWLAHTVLLPIIAAVHSSCFIAPLTGIVIMLSLSHCLSVCLSVCVCLFLCSFVRCRCVTVVFCSLFGSNELTTVWPPALLHCDVGYGTPGMSILVLSLSLWPSPWKVLVLTIVIHIIIIIKRQFIRRSNMARVTTRVETSSVSAENNFSHLRCLQRCLDFGAEWLDGKIRNSSHWVYNTEFRFWKCILLITCVAEHTGILWCSLFFRFNLSCHVTENCLNQNTCWWMKLELELLH